MLFNFQYSAIKNIALFGDKISLPTYIISAVLIITGFSLAAYFNVELYLLLGIVGIMLFWIMLHYPKIWIYCVVIACILFFDEDEKGVSAADIFSAVFLNTFLIVWFASKLLVKSEKYIITKKSSSTLKINRLSEKLFLLFYFLLIFNSVIAVANDIDFFDWIREFMLFSLILYYFPIRDYFDDKRSITILLILFALVGIRFSIRQFYMVYELMNNVIMAWEIGETAWKINHEFYSAIILIGISIFLYTKNKTGKLFSYIVVVLTAFTLISTFARAYWISVIALIALLSIIYCSPKQFLQLFTVVVLTTGILFVSLNTLFPTQSQYIQAFISTKFASSTQGRADPSVEARFREYEVVKKEIYEFPMFGHGLRKRFSFYYNPKGYTYITSFIHNGYLNFAHKTGIPMAAIFYFTMLLFNIRGYIVAWRLKRYCARNKLNPKNEYHFFTAIVIGASLTITMLMITNMITSSFIMRSGLIVVAFCLAFITIAERKYNTLKIKKHTIK